MQIFILPLAFFIILIVARLLYDRSLPRKAIDHGFGRLQKITCYRGGQTKEEIWYLNQKQHRADNLPACAEYHRDGQIREAEWYVNGRYVRGCRK